jgi:Tol biopolymer transport system component
MFGRKKITYSGFSDYSNIKKIVYISIIFVVIAVIWAGYFFIKYYSNSENINLKGTIYYKSKPISDVNVTIDNQNVVSDQNGNYILSNLKFGRVTVKYEKRGYIASEESIFLWRKNQTAPKIDLVRDEAYSASFSGIILNDFDDTPIKDAVIKLGEANTMSDDAGTFEFLDMPKGEMNLQISTVGFLDYSENIVLNSAPNESKEYKLTPYGRVSFTSTRDGKKNIYAINYDGKNLTNLTSKIKGDCWGGVFVPGTGSIVFYSDFEGGIDQWGQKLSSLYLLEKGSDKPIKISQDIIPEGDFKIARNGARIVFTGKKKDSDKIEIYIAGLTKKEEWVQLTDNDLTESNIDISPDGTWVIYGAFTNVVRDIYSQKIGSYTAEKISSSPNRESYLSYSPDGKKILYVRQTLDFRSTVYVYDIAGKKEREIYKTSTDIKNIAWNKASDKLVFTSTRDGKNDIYTINANGGNEIKLTSQPSDYQGILWPDLEKILVFIVKKDDGNSLEVMDVSKRTVKEIEMVSDDILSWDNEVFDTTPKEGL